MPLKAVRNVGSLWSQRHFSLMKKKNLSKITLNEPLEEESATRPCILHFFGKGNFILSL